MREINDVFINAILSDATYALDRNNIQGYSGSDLISLISSRMTPELAKYIGENFTVVTHHESGDVLGSGFDATVWQRNSDGKYFVSMQGSKGLMDFVVDADLTVSGTATAQIMDMVNWWLRITTPVGQQADQYMYASQPGPDLGAVVVMPAPSADGEGWASNVGSIEVVGHSLGGHLATSFARIFGNTLSIDGVSTFNSAGFNPFSDVLFSQLKAHLDGASLDDFYVGQQNFYGENGISATTRDWLNVNVGNRVPLSNEESAFPVDNHYMYKITDLLALGSVLESLDSSFTFEKLNALLDAGANETAASIEGVFDAARKLFGEFSNPTPIGDVPDSAASRMTYYENLFAMRDFIDTQALEGRFSIQTATTVNDARSNFGVFLSLMQLTPFILSANDGVAATALQTAHEDITALWMAGSAGVSDMFLQDRIEMFGAITAMNASDIAANDVGGDTYYADMDSGLVISDMNANQKRIVFGSDNANDLYGMGGDDILTGDGRGNDAIVEGLFTVPVFSFSTHKAMAVHTRKAGVNPAALRRTRSAGARSHDVQLVAPLKMAA